jgi:hypothetical protein
MLVEEIAADEFRRMVHEGQVNDLVAVGLPGAWAVNIVSDQCREDAMTLQPPQFKGPLHARYWHSLAELDEFLQEAGVVAYSVDRTFYDRELPQQARDSGYFPAGPEEFLDHEFMIYIRSFLDKEH